MAETVETNEIQKTEKKGSSAKIIVIIIAIVLVLALVIVGGIMLAKPKGPTLTYLGHASVKIKSSKGTVIYIDPYCEEVANGYKEPADIILVTHDHQDHSKVSLCEQKDGCTVITRKEALLNKTEYQTFEIDDVKIEALDATQIKDVSVFMEIAGYDAWDGTVEAIPTTVLIPSFIVSELRTAFIIGFVIYINSIGLIKYTLVILAAKRAREITKPSENPKEKEVSSAFKEIYNDQITYERPKKY